MSSSLIQVTVVPVFTVTHRREGECVDVHFLIQDLRRRNRNGGRYREHSEPERSRDGEVTCRRCHDPDLPPQRCRGWSMIARRCCPRLKVTSVTPRSERSLSSATFIGPGEGAAPGAGCGKAVDMAVWNVTLPSTFCMIW